MLVLPLAALCMECLDVLDSLFLRSSGWFVVDEDL
jgi:hypothetical protein